MFRLLVAALMCVAVCSCVAVPKHQAIAKDVRDSPGSSVDSIAGDEMLVAAVAKKMQTTIAETDQSASEQTGEVNTSVESRVSAGGNVNSDDWTSRIMAIGGLLWPLGFAVYIIGHRSRLFRWAVDLGKGKSAARETSQIGVCESCQKALSPKE